MSGDVKDELKQRLARAGLAVQSLQSRLDAVERARIEPIAIIGMGCHFPGGADTPVAYWELLRSGRDAIRREPEARRVGPAGRARWGGYLEDVSGFDADFFGISPREAASMDPRQRMLLEVSWEALEHAGVDPEGMLGTPTGVFLGLTGNDYERLLPTEPERIEPYFGTGNGHCFPPGRVSYALGLQGPSLSVDTACSSSLVAVHLACQSLRGGECDVALAGGANLVLDPFVTETLLRMNALSPNGRCSAFDARANGFVRGEGAGVVVLRRLSDAQARGDSILAVIRGSALNQDGRSTGFTAPSVLAQQAVLRQALVNAKVAPSAIGYVEAHGTGTPLGDPIEVEALREVLGGTRPDGSR
ncbi:MAG TPA: polyketide synthase, partial [Myxococcaceae bacterium]|nr:polyketide synthase [Myxococcaceae bacterium]